MNRGSSALRRIIPIQSDLDTDMRPLDLRRDESSEQDPTAQSGNHVGTPLRSPRSISELRLSASSRPALSADHGPGRNLLDCEAETMRGADTTSPGDVGPGARPRPG